MNNAFEGIEPGGSSGHRGPVLTRRGFTGVLGAASAAAVLAGAGCSSSASSDGGEGGASGAKVATAAKLLAALLPLALACACLLCGCSGAPSPQDAGGGAAEGGAASSEGPEEAYPLSDWEWFDRCWERTDGGDGTYSEVGEDGSVVHYRMRDGYEPNGGVEYSPILYGAERVGSPQDGDIVAVDCSTGEVSYWVLDERMREVLESDDANADSLAANFIYRREDGGWLTYTNIPMREDDGSGIVEPVYWLTIEETAQLWMDDMPEDARRIILENSPELREYLVEHYGEEAVAPYED